jgi:hypothetical protein
MAADVLQQGPERPPTSPRLRTVAVVLAGLAVVLAGALQVRGDEPAVDRSPEEPLRPLPRVLLDRAGVLTVRPAAGGVLQLRVGLEGVPGAQLLSLDVELPGSAVVLLPTPDRLADDGTALLALDVLPRCPDALPGVYRGAVNAVVRGRDGARVRQVRVRLDTAGVLADTVRTRCGAVAGVPDLRTSFVELDGPAGEPLRTRVEVSPTGTQPVTVVAVRPGPGLATTVRTRLPLVVTPGAAAASVRVDLRPGGCGGAPDTPPYVLVLSTGEAVATSVAPALQAPLDRLRPYLCAG